MTYQQGRLPDHMQIGMSILQKLFQLHRDSLERTVLLPICYQAFAVGVTTSNHPHSFRFVIVSVQTIASRFAAFFHLVVHAVQLNELAPCRPLPGFQVN
jgi:hypothetical protein